MRVVHHVFKSIRTTSKQEANETTNTIPTHVGNMIGIRSHRTTEMSTRCNRSVTGTGEETSGLDRSCGGCGLNGPCDIR